MTDEIPADLIALKRELYAATDALRELSAAMPSAAAIASGEAVVDPEQQARWTALHDRSAELAAQIQRHPTLGEAITPERLRVDAAASKAARGQS